MYHDTDTGTIAQMNHDRPTDTIPSTMIFDIFSILFLVSIAKTQQVA